MVLIKNKLQHIKLKKYVLILFFSLFIIHFTGCTVITQQMPEQFSGFGQDEIKTYYMKQKVWTIGDQFIVKDHFDKPMFYIKGKIFTFGDRLKLYNMEGEELLYIKQKLLSLNKKYKIYHNEKLYAKVIKKLVLFKNKYVIDIEGPDDYTIKGDFFNYQYYVFFKGRKVASISKKLVSFIDKYRINIIPGQDDPLIIAAAVIIDMISHKNENNDIFD